MAHPQTTPADVQAILAAARDKIDRHRAIEPYLIDPARLEPDSNFYKTLVTSTKAIAWSIDWASKKFTYTHRGLGVAETLTISAGVATIVPSGNGDRAEFIESVDKRLYQAKLKGRNRVVGSSATMERDEASSVVE